MAGVGPGRSATSRRTRVKGQRRSPTWEISDSDFEGDATAEAGAGAQSAAGKRRAASEARRPEQALQRLVVRVDPAVLEDPGSDILMEALSALGCECRIELQSPARSLQWSGLKPDPQAPSVLPEVWATEDQELLLLLEPEEFLQGVTQLTQSSGPPCSMPWISPESPAHVHVAIIGLDAYLWSHQLSAQRPQQPVCPEVAQTQMTIGWPEVEEALVLLQLLRNMDVLLVASWQELSRHQALLDCSTDQERLGLLADLPVKAHKGRQHRRGQQKDLEKMGIPGYGPCGFRGAKQPGTVSRRGFWAVPRPTAIQRLSWWLPWEK
ncbi:probable crossover junction endonuclease EME2 isoform X4 [Fukomys damarensis]|uniref:probable crossover junction endonuclease EME2 isoform X4 n=1 Tax=Fukomys damarensis TaxID=885580 RepID=UPI00053FCA62|nr:probable crossover junction endonuclease EME2 isoform X4 [Fukomys damarensis]